MTELIGKHTIATENGWFTEGFVNREAKNAFDKIKNYIEDGDYILSKVYYLIMETQNLKNSFKVITDTYYRIPSENKGAFFMASHFSTGITIYDVALCYDGFVVEYCFRLVTNEDIRHNYVEKI